jgi:hypothetical protein
MCRRRDDSELEHHRLVLDARLLEGIAEGFKAMLGVKICG